MTCRRFQANPLLKQMLSCELSPWEHIPDSKVHGANMGPTWILSAPDGPHIGPMNLAIGDCREIKTEYEATFNLQKKLIIAL